MFTLGNKKKLSLNYPQYPLLSGALNETEGETTEILRYVGILSGTLTLPFPFSIPFLNGYQLSK